MWRKKNPYISRLQRHGGDGAGSGNTNGDGKVKIHKNGDGDVAQSVREPDASQSGLLQYGQDHRERELRRGQARHTCSYGMEGRGDYIC